MASWLLQSSSTPPTVDACNNKKEAIGSWDGEASAQKGGDTLKKKKTASWATEEKLGMVETIPSGDHLWVVL